MTSKVDEIAMAIDQFLTHNVERDTLACDLTPDELTELATGILSLANSPAQPSGDMVEAVRYLVKVADWAAGEGFCQVEGLPTDPDEWMCDFWSKHGPEDGDGYSADAVADKIIAATTALQAELSEERHAHNKTQFDLAMARKARDAEIVAWLRAEAQLCDCHAREEGECACGAWGSEPGERSYKSVYIEDIADAIERGEV